MKNKIKDIIGYQAPMKRKIFFRKNAEQKEYFPNRKEKRNPTCNVRVSPRLAA